MQHVRFMKRFISQLKKKDKGYVFPLAYIFSHMSWHVALTFLMFPRETELLPSAYQGFKKPLLGEINSIKSMAFLFIFIIIFLTCYDTGISPYKM